MLRIVIVVTLAALATAPRNAAAQELGTPDGGPAADSLAPAALYQPAVQVPDSVRRKVGYQHLEGWCDRCGSRRHRRASPRLGCTPKLLPLRPQSRSHEPQCRRLRWRVGFSGWIGVTQVPLTAGHRTPERPEAARRRCSMT